MKSYYYVIGGILLVALVYFLHQQEYITLPFLSKSKSDSDTNGNGVSGNVNNTPKPSTQPSSNSGKLIWKELPIKESYGTANIATAVVQMYCNLAWRRGNQDLGLSIKPDIDGVMPLLVDGKFGKKTKAGMKVVNLNSNTITSTTIKEIRKKLAAFGSIGLAGMDVFTGTFYDNKSDKVVCDAMYSKLSEIKGLTHR